MDKAKAVLPYLSLHSNYALGLLALLLTPLAIAFRAAFTKAVQTLIRAFANRAKLANDNLRLQGTISDLEDRVDEEKERADYWQDSRNELTQRVDDLELRLQDAAAKLSAAVADIVDIRQKLSIGQERIQSLSADREALLIYALAAQTELARMGVDIGVQFPVLKQKPLNVLHPEAT